MDHPSAALTTRDIDQVDIDMLTLMPVNLMQSKSARIVLAFWLRSVYNNITFSLAHEMLAYADTYSSRATSLTANVAKE